MGQLQDSYTVVGSGQWPIGDYIGKNYETVQTFKAGANYNINSVKLKLTNASVGTGTLTIGIYAVSGGEPSGAALTTGNMDLSTMSLGSAWYEITLSSPTALTSGAEYAIVASSADNSENVSWLKSDGNYTNGKAGYARDGGEWLMSDTTDLLFETYDDFSPPVDIITYKRLVAVGNNEFWYEDI